MFEGIPEERKEEVRRYVKEYGQRAQAICQLAEGMEEGLFDAMVALMIKKHAEQQHRNIMKVVAEVKRILIMDITVGAMGWKDDIIKEVMDIMGARDEGK